MLHLFFLFNIELLFSKMETIDDEVLRGNQLDVPPSQSTEQYICAARNHMRLSYSYPHHCPSFFTDITRGEMVMVMICFYFLSLINQLVSIKAADVK